MENITITISKAIDQEEDGFMYDIYLCEPDEIVDCEGSVDGGFCTGSMVDAIEMAKEQAVEIINRLNKN